MILEEKKKENERQCQRAINVKQAYKNSTMQP